MCPVHHSLLGWHSSSTDVQERAGILAGQVSETVPPWLSGATRTCCITLVSQIRTWHAILPCPMGLDGHVQNSDMLPCGNPHARPPTSSFEVCFVRHRVASGAVTSAHQIKRSVLEIAPLEEIRSDTRPTLGLSMR